MDLEIWNLKWGISKTDTKQSPTNLGLSYGVVYCLVAFRILILSIPF